MQERKLELLKLVFAGRTK